MDLSPSLLAILEAVNQGIHVVDQNGVTVVYNRAASEIDGLSKDEVVGKSVLSVFPSLDQHSSTLLRVLRSGLPEVDQQQTFTNYKGKKITTLNSTYPIFVDGKVTGACEVSTDITRLKEMAERIVDLRRELRSRRKKTALSKTLYTLDDIVGESQAMREVKRTAAKVAQSDSGVMVWGETGTGKELLVQAIHSASDRAHAPFIPQNCAAMPESLLESLVFGTSKGGFTGATDRPGLMELAAGGTLYLDEVDSMPLGLQAKMLRAIQEKRVRRLGDTKERPVDVRFISSTSMPPREAVKAGLLRSDLYYRLSVVEIGLPRLRDRREDIPLLCDHFLHKHSPDHPLAQVKAVSPAVMAAFLAYEWPGNVRELEHAIEGSLALSRGPLIELEDLPPAVRGIGHTASVYMENSAVQSRLSDRLDGHKLQADQQPADRIVPGKSEEGGALLKDRLRQEEKALIEAAISESGTVAGAAKKLGIPRQTLQYRMRILGVGARMPGGRKGT